jgi:non-ribosomal peptide synthetase component F
MLPAQSPNQLPNQLLAWNDTAVDYPRSSTIAELFAQQAARTPGHIALIAGARQFTYRELDPAPIASPVIFSPSALAVTLSSAWP